MKNLQNNWFKFFLLGLCFIIAWKVVDIPAIYNWLKFALSILSPFIFGSILAFFTYKPTKNLEHFIKGHIPKLSLKLCRIISIILVYALLIGAAVIGLRFLVPSVYKNIQDLVENLPQYYTVAEKFVKDFEIASDMKIVEKISETISAYLNFDLIGKFVGVFTNIANSLLNVFLGIIISIYILIERNSLANIFKTLMGFILKDKKKNAVFTYLGEVMDIFNSYFIGLLIDAILIGSVSLIFFSIFGAPYPWLLALIVAIGNMIPFFGPIVSAIISYIASAIVLGPLTSLWVLVFQILLGQLDANFIQPKIVGSSVGISPFWVILSVTFFGGIWGVVGMVVGVPIIAAVRLVYHDYKDDGMIGNPSN